MTSRRATRRRGRGRYGSLLGYLGGGGVYPPMTRCPFLTVLGAWLLLGCVLQPMPPEESRTPEPHVKPPHEVPDALFWEFVDESLEPREGYARPDFRPTQGFVPDERTAIQIAEAVAIAIWGEEQIATERPFYGRLKDGVWTVIGTLPIEANGGTAVVQLSQEDGRVLFVVHQE
ncbi:MAG: hypothetical protein GC160_23515 [Acidobacteria bacterium]|nr:hypothetical protein [Acidobacteriota bacterium]